MKISTVIIRPDECDSNYSEISNLISIKAGNYQNEIFFNDLKKVEAYNREKDLCRHPPDEIERIISKKPSIAVAGQTKLAENTIIDLTKNLPDLIAVRYSSFYNVSDHGHEYTILPSGKIERGREYGVNLADAAYSLDCSKDQSILIQLISNEQLIEAIIKKDRAKLKQAIEQLNSALSKPIKFTEHFTKIFQN